MEKRLKNTQSKSDNDITDEEAGRARVELARQSSLRRQDSARSLARANNDMKHRLAQVREWPAAEHAPLQSTHRCSPPLRSTRARPLLNGVSSQI